jgi:hypothetical protein
MSYAWLKLKDWMPMRGRLRCGCKCRFWVQGSEVHGSGFRGSGSWVQWFNVQRF